MLLAFALFPTIRAADTLSMTAAKLHQLIPSITIHDTISIGQNLILNRHLIQLLDQESPTHSAQMRDPILIQVTKLLFDTTVPLNFASGAPASKYRPGHLEKDFVLSLAESLQLTPETLRDDAPGSSRRVIASSARRCTRCGHRILPRNRPRSVWM